MALATLEPSLQLRYWATKRAIRFSTKILILDIKILHQKCEYSSGTIPFPLRSTLIEKSLTSGFGGIASAAVLIWSWGGGGICR